MGRIKFLALRRCSDFLERFYYEPRHRHFIDREVDKTMPHIMYRFLVYGAFENYIEESLADYEKLFKDDKLYEEWLGYFRKLLKNVQNHEESVMGDLTRVINYPTSAAQSFANELMNFLEP